MLEHSMQILSAILGNHPEVSTRSDRCVHGSAGDVWRCLFSPTWKVRRVSAASSWFLTHEPRRFWHGNSSLDIRLTGQAAQSNVWFGVLSQLRRTQHQKLLRKHSGSNLSWQRCGLLSRALSPRFLRTVEMGFSAPTDCDTLRLLQSLPSCQIRQGYWIG